MKCELAQENIVLYVYGELPDETSHELEQHLLDCERCQHEFQVTQALQQAMALAPIAEPSPNLLAQSRIRLEEALDTMPAHGPIGRLRNLFNTWSGQIRTAPALTAMLVVAGFTSGHLTGHYQVSHTPAPRTAMVLSNSTGGSITNVSGIVQTPNSEIVQVNYTRSVPESLQGSLDDPQIRQLLLLATQNRVNNGVREDSVALLAGECKAGHACGGIGENGTGEGGGAVRSALMVSLRYDKSPAVREKALEGLQRYIAEDTRVRDAVLEALMHDPNARVRTAAINIIEPVQADSSVRQVLHTISTQDQNPYIRNTSRQVLEQVSDIQ